MSGSCEGLRQNGRMTCLRSLFVVLALALSGCAAETSTDSGAAPAASSEDELRSVATSFFERQPLSGAPLENLRRAVGHADDGYAWTRNQGTSFGMQWETKHTGALTDSDRTALAQAAFAFHVSSNGGKSRKYLGKVAFVATTDAALDAAVDTVGLSTSEPDASTLAARAKIVKALGAAARAPSVTVLTGTLHYQVDMYWENALVVIDERNHQLLVVTGGYGT